MVTRPFGYVLPEFSTGATEVFLVNLTHTEDWPATGGGVGSSPQLSKKDFMDLSHFPVSYSLIEDGGILCSKISTAIF